MNRADWARRRSAVLPRTAGRRRPLRLTLAAALIGIGCFQLFSRPASAEEPAQDFVRQLRAAGYFDTAIVYLDRLDQYPGVPQTFKDAAPLEKAQTFIEAAVAARSTKERDGHFVSAQEQLKEFLKQSDHPRLAEARLQLGKLQLVRADQLMSGRAPDDEVRKEARESCLAAAETFKSIVEDLREKLEAMQGQKIDPAKEPEKIALRDQYRNDFLEAQVRIAEAKQLAAETYDDPAKDGKKLLEEALETFTELSDKYGRYLQGALAMLHRGQVQQTLGKSKEAMDSYQRVLEQPEVDQLRASRLKAMTGLTELRLTADPPKIDEAITQAKRLVDGARPNERRSPEFAALQVALAGAHLAAAEAARAENKQGDVRRNTTAARPLLTAAVKIPGTHESDAREMLASLGIEKKEETAAERPVVETPKSLEEALASAREYLQANDELEKSKQLLQKRADEGDAEAAEQIEAIEEQLAEGRAVLVEILRSGLALGEREADLLNQARQYLAFTLFQRGDHWEAAAVGQFLSRSASGSQEGLRGGLLALSALQHLLRNASQSDDESSPADAKQGIVAQIESLGAHLASTWPNDPQAAAAKGTLIRLALDADRWDEARRLLAEMPEGVERASFQRLMGQLMWNQSLKLRQENREEEADAALADAEKELTAGLEGIPGALTGPDALPAALVLAKVKIKQDDPAGALKVLDNKKYGPLPLVEKLGEPTDGFKSDLYSLELQSVVGVMTAAESDTQKLLQRATKSMEKLQETVKGKDDAGDRLVRIYLRLARDIREQLDAAEGERKEKLIKAFQVFLDSIAKSSRDPATLQWVGQTLMALGESAMGPNDVRAQGPAAELITSARNTFTGLQEKLGEETPTALKFQLARAHRLSGKYKEAIDLLEAILKQSPSMLDAQIEAAQAYEQWAGNVSPQYAGRAYGSALSGARPDAQGTNVIWGWGKISRIVSGRPEFREQFFEARYRIALCRFLKGKAEDNQRVIEQASSDITQVAALYPELGGPERRRQFDLLMREIQKSLGKPVEGLGGG